MWETHFNHQYHSGGWRGLALRAPAGGSRRAHPGDAAVGDYSNTPLLERTPALAAVLAALPCPLKSVRLLTLEAGGWIREHRDPGVNLHHGEARLHVPILTSEQVYFYVNGQRVPFRAGELWYIDIDQPHRAVNLGAQARVHLVIDCLADDWLHEQLRLSDSGEPWPADTGDPQQAFASFRDLVFQDETLQAALQAATDTPAFIDRTVTLGREHGFTFTAAEVQSALNQGRRVWIEQFLF